MKKQEFELFDKIYGCYYQAVRKILEEASRSPVTRERMEEICRETAFGESHLTIVPKLINGRWSCLSSSDDGKLFSSALSCTDLSFPLTRLQKAWLKALLSDRRIRLFFPESELDLLEDALKDTEPLFDLQDFYYFDQYRDGDPYEDKQYISSFRAVLTALIENRVLLLSYGGKTGEPSVMEAAPCRIQYSPKDDKFRLLAVKRTKRGFTIPYIFNISRILDCRPSPEKLPESFHPEKWIFSRAGAEPVRIEIDGRRNSLERCMLHFANYEKHTEFDEARGVYLCSIFYDPQDETELLIELLSFGPVIRVLGPETMLSQIRERVARQHELFYK